MRGLLVRFLLAAPLHPGARANSPRALRPRGALRRARRSPRASLRGGSPRARCRPRACACSSCGSASCAGVASSTSSTWASGSSCAASDRDRRRPRRRRRLRRRRCDGRRDLLERRAALRAELRVRQIDRLAAGADLLRGRRRSGDRRRRRGSGGGAAGRRDGAARRRPLSAGARAGDEPAVRARRARTGAGCMNSGSGETEVRSSSSSSNGRSTLCSSGHGSMLIGTGGEPSGGVASSPRAARASSGESSSAESSSDIDGIPSAGVSCERLDRAWSACVLPASSS